MVSKLEGHGLGDGPFKLIETPAHAQKVSISWSLQFMLLWITDVASSSAGTARPVYSGRQSHGSCA
jgi:hypothetical protein